MSITQSTINSTYHLARKMDDGEEDTRSVDGLTAYKFGYPMSSAPIIAEEASWEVAQIPTLGTGYSQLMRGNISLEPIKADFIMVNSIPFKMITGYENKEHGSYSANVTHVYEDMPTTVGRLQRYSLVKEVDSDTYEFPACFMDNLVITYDTGDRLLIAESTFMPFKRVKNTATPSERIFPENNSGAEVEGAFTNLSTSTWNSETWSGIEGIKISFAREARLITVNSSGEHIYNQPRNLNTMFTVNCVELATGQDDDMEDGTARDINFKITKADTDRYIDITLKNCIMKNIGLGLSIQEPKRHMLVGFAEDWVIIGSDNVKDTEIDEPTET